MRTRACALEVARDGVGGCGEKAPGQGLCQSGHRLSVLLEFASICSGCPDGHGEVEGREGAEAFGQAEGPGLEQWVQWEASRMEGQGPSF